MELKLNETSLKNTYRFEASINVELSKGIAVTKILNIPLGKHSSLKDVMQCMANSDIVLKAINSENVLNKVFERLKGVSKVSLLNFPESEINIDMRAGIYSDGEKIYAHSKGSGDIAVYSYSTGKIVKILERYEPEVKLPKRRIPTIKNIM